MEAAKDVSNAGILGMISGTISIMIENSGKGAVIELDSIPKPAEIELPDWLICFQSLGFILSVQQERSKEVIVLFKEREITATVMGKVTDSSVVIL